ncbi:MAG: N-acetylglucosamine kinase [Thermoproteota archaeon]
MNKDLATKIQELFAGIDAGGTSSVGIAASREGFVKGFEIGGPANLQIFGLDSCIDTIVSIVRKLIKSNSVLKCIGVGVPGARLKGDQEKLSKEISNALDCKAVVTGDVELACHACFPSGDGVVVVAGTGSSARAISDGSIIARAGGWGPLLGDDGSAYWIGLEALRSVVRAVDGSGDITRLCEAIKERFDLSSYDDLVRISMSLSREQIASLAELVHEVAKGGDEVSIRILQQAGRELGSIASVVARRVGRNIRLALVGGVFNAGEYVRSPLLEVLKRIGIEASVIEPKFPPCVGGLILAYRAFGIEDMGSVLQNLEASLSASSYKI